ncbi:MAG: flagellar protein FlaG [Desulfobacteraceae bacterium]|nr:flagellar protein FlaG [Desulfobacteraceae bacterium]
MDTGTINATAKVTDARETQIPMQSTVENNRQTRQMKEQKTEEQKKVLSAQDAKELTLEMNEIMDDLQTSLGFSIHKELHHQVVVKIKNRETNELIKQIPAEELLEIKQKMVEFTGLLFNQSV